MPIGRITERVTGGVSRVEDRVQGADSDIQPGEKVPSKWNPLNIRRVSRINQDESDGTLKTAEIPNLDERLVPAKRYYQEEARNSRTGEPIIDRETGRPVMRTVEEESIPGAYVTEKVKGRGNRRVVTSKIDKVNVPQRRLEQLRRRGIVPAIISRIREGMSPETREVKQAYDEIAREALETRSNPETSRGVDHAESDLIEHAGPELADRAVAARRRREIRKAHNRTIGTALRESGNAEKILDDIARDPVDTSERGFFPTLKRITAAAISGQLGGTDESVRYHPQEGLRHTTPQRERSKGKYSPQDVNPEMLSVTVDTPIFIDWFNRARTVIGKEPVHPVKWGKVRVVEVPGSIVVAEAFSLSAYEDVERMNEALQANQTLTTARGEAQKVPTYQEMGMKPEEQLDRSRKFKRRAQGTPSTPLRLQERRRQQQLSARRKEE